MDPAATWDRIEESELKVAGVTSGTGFGRSVGLRIRGKIFAIYKDGELIVKLPTNRVGELTESGRGRPWGPGSRIMKEWVAVSEAAPSSALARHEQDDGYSPEVYASRRLIRAGA